MGSENLHRDRTGSPVPWEVKGLMVRDPNGILVAYVQYDRDRREIAAAPLVVDALDGLMHDLVALAKLLEPEGGIEALEDRVPGLLRRYNAAYSAVNQARWRKP